MGTVDRGYCRRSRGVGDYQPKTFESAEKTPQECHTERDLFVLENDRYDIGCKRSLRGGVQERHSAAEARRGTSLTGDGIMEKKKQSSLGIIGVVPRLVGSSVGAAAVCARKILFGHDEETPEPAPERAADKPKKKTTNSIKNKQKKKHAKASPKH